MQGRYRRPQMSRARARQRALQRRRRFFASVAAVAVVCIVAVVLLLGRGQGGDRQVSAPVPTPEAAPVVEATLAPTEVPVALVATPTPTPAPTPVPEAAATPAPNSNRAMTRPTPTAEGFLPVFSKAINTEEKIIAITVDDCFQANNLRKIVDKALEYGGKLTIFPIGENVLREEQGKILKDAWEHGFELENHTYTHNGLYRISDQRMQMYSKQLGYYGIAHWSCAGSTSSDSEMRDALKPGAIYLFHTTNNDWDKLERFIPWVAEQGYQMVTLNEMFDYPDNETSELTMPANEYPIPPLEPYTRVYTPLKKTTYSYYAYLFQQKLIELGYLTGEPDGIYGAGCVTAVTKYQHDHNMEETGIASPELQMELLGP